MNLIPLLPPFLLLVPNFGVHVYFSVFCFGLFRVMKFTLFCEVVGPDL